MKRVIIVGGGFAGLSAAQTLHRRRDVEVVLFDQRTTWDFLPMVPDLIGERTRPEVISYPIEELAQKYRFRFVNDAVIDIDPADRIVTTANDGSVDCDYLVIAAGGQTNFRGQTEIEKSAHRIDSVRDAMRVRETLAAGRHETVIVVGGGYTGIEAATELWAYRRKHGTPKRIVVAEAMKDILLLLGDRCREYVRRHLDRMQIEVRTETSLTAIDGDCATLSTSETLEPACVIWAAGVQTPKVVRDIDVPKARDGRLEVGPTLEIAPRCYAVGDSACVMYGGKPLRQSVQFAFKEGQHAAKNILRDIKGLVPEAFRPHDPGFVVPLANDRGCGTVLGAGLSGILPSKLHYAMSIFRSRGLKRRLGIMPNLLGLR